MKKKWTQIWKKLNWNQIWNKKKKKQNFKNIKNKTKLKIMKCKNNFIKRVHLYDQLVLSNLVVNKWMCLVSKIQPIHLENIKESNVLIEKPIFLRWKIKEAIVYTFVVKRNVYFMKIRDYIYSFIFTLEWTYNLKPISHKMYSFPFLNQTLVKLGREENINIIKSVCILLRKPMNKQMMVFTG